MTPAWYHPKTTHLISSFCWDWVILVLNPSKNNKGEVKKGTVCFIKLSGTCGCPTTVVWSSALQERALMQLGQCSCCSAAPQQAECGKQESSLYTGLEWERREERRFLAPRWKQGENTFKCLASESRASSQLLPLVPLEKSKLFLLLFQQSSTT